MVIAEFGIRLLATSDCPVAAWVGVVWAWCRWWEYAPQAVQPSRVVQRAMGARWACRSRGGEWRGPPLSLEAACAAGAGVFELQILEFSNYRAALASGACCGGAARAAPEQACAAPCRTKFSLCLKEYQSAAAPGACSFGSAASPVLGTDSFTLAEPLYTLALPFSFRWTRSFTLILQAYDDFEYSDPEAGLVEEAWWSGIVEPSAEWHALQHAGAAAAVAYRVRVLCQPNYYNTTCTTFCRPRDDKFGHYSCTAEGAKRCLPGWQGDNCEKRDCVQGGLPPDARPLRPPRGLRVSTLAMRSLAASQQCGSVADWSLRMLSVAGRAGAASCAPSASRTQAASTATATAPPGTVPATPTGAASCVTKHGGTCENTAPDQYLCRCAEGFSGTDCERVDNPCAPQPCVHGECSLAASPRGFACACARGWAGALCDQDVDDCASAPCRNGATCRDRLDAFVCDCAPGWTGPTCTEDINECEQRGADGAIAGAEGALGPCVNAAACNNTAGGYSCACLAGWTGRDCEANVDDCTGQCLNGATCIDLVDDFHCACAAGYAGRTCALDVDDCAPRPCRNGGECVDLLNAYRCICPVGFSGTNCEVPAAASLLSLTTATTAPALRAGTAQPATRPRATTTATAPPAGPARTARSAQRKNSSWGRWRRAARDMSCCARAESDACVRPPPPPRAPALRLPAPTLRRALRPACIPPARLADSARPPLHYTALLCYRGERVRDQPLPQQRQLRGRRRRLHLHLPRRLDRYAN
ncbi:unnamed protein product [Spodoptera exigua]|nr:unnamed protein product [Spodoptera exigua]